MTSSYELKIKTGYKDELVDLLSHDNFKSCLYNIATFLRNKKKYTEDQNTTWEEVYFQVYEIFSDFKIDPFE